MKKVVLFAALLVLSAGLVQTASAQATATQTVNLSVGAIWRLTVSGNPGALVAAGGVAGSDTVGTASDLTTSYSLTQNANNAARITAGTGSALPAGLFLVTRLLSGRAQTAGYVDLSDGTTRNVITNIPFGADRNNAIEYYFTAVASAGTFAGTRTVTLTLTN